ncbi:hypothetical protein [Paracoccus aerodenitrificans]|uniref:hypothetical protein n=1 Tax=Paracoccus aerodenitrificans TaxID=3017781 RepID=UPI0022EFE537|nr:hypothetical protein [Paracoccus aerodenitrificans]WBU65398.1 hypothetical protein PAE61_08265 [Paracoccus aerodenitrificans]
MSVQSTEYKLTLRDRVASFFSAIGRLIEDAAYAQSRAPQIEALYAKSDEELARLGIKRDEIVYYVFRDRAWI